LLQPNFRGTPAPDLVCRLQEHEDYLSDLKATPWAYDGADEWIQIISDEIASMRRELLRRRSMPEIPQSKIDPELINTLKARIRIDDVLSWYTEIKTSMPYSKKTMQYRCTLHGSDSSPSGVIYLDENRYWCFGCNSGGDVIDAVVAFERIDIGSAIGKLARYIGLQSRPIIPVNNRQHNENWLKTSGIL